MPSRPTRIRWNQVEKLLEPQFLTRADLVIFGGGGQYDLSRSRTEFFNQLPPGPLYAHWGTGFNSLDASKINWIDETAVSQGTDSFASFALFGSRDFNENRHGSEYLPCPSARIRHLRGNYSVRRPIGVIQHAFLPFDYPVGLPEELPSISMDLSRFSIARIIRFIAESELIVSSSYHAIYWAQLLGKRAQPVSGWSSKFSGLKFATPEFATVSELEALTAPDYPELLEESIELNDSFAKKVRNLTVTI